MNLRFHTPSIIRFLTGGEQDPEEIVRALIKTVENILQKLHPRLPLLCSFCSAMHSLIAVDKNGNGHFTIHYLGG
ncbi:MAG: hypothetical protein WDM78_17370 [Puia sp.]